MSKVEINPWKTLTNEVVHESDWIRISKRDVIAPTGKPGKYSLVHFKNIAIGIIPLDEENNTWIVGQHRYPINQYSWEIVEGGGKIGIDPLESAQRELLEETGLKAQQWEKILEMHLSNSATDEFAMIYVARNLTQLEAEPDDTEQLQIKKIPFIELYQMVMEGKITDSLSVAGVLKLKLLFDKTSNLSNK